LGLTQAAVSQYINGKRARTAKLDEHTSQLLESLARDIRDEEVVNLSRRICKVCNYINDNDQLLENCGVERESVKEASAS
ncbi:hypothetical protein K9M78_05915, partial [Candidatus Bipolaricaulota bacterium]|nr:hypothetical protein [Candidatus Bipolaricaulota bacterium]